MIEGGARVPLDMGKLSALIVSACANLGADVKAEPILAETHQLVVDAQTLANVGDDELAEIQTLIEKDPAYTP